MGKIRVRHLDHEIELEGSDEFINKHLEAFYERIGAIPSSAPPSLDEKLGIRNTCAHPSGVEVHPTKVVNFVEDLLDNVLSKYPI